MAPKINLFYMLVGSPMTQHYILFHCITNRIACLRPNSDQMVVLNNRKALFSPPLPRIRHVCMTDQLLPIGSLTYVFLQLQLHPPPFFPMRCRALVKPRFYKYPNGCMTSQETLRSASYTSTQLPSAVNFFSFPGKRLLDRR